MFTSSTLTEMFTNNPFAELSYQIPSSFIQLYVIAMVVLVFLGTLFDPPLARVIAKTLCLSIIIKIISLLLNIYL